MIIAVQNRETQEIVLTLRTSKHVSRHGMSGIASSGFPSSQYEILFLTEMPDLKSPFRFENPFPTSAGIPVVEGEIIPRYRRIAMISSWDVACGIAEYTRELIRWIERVDIIPIRQMALFDDAMYDVIHIQYEPGLFKHSQMQLWVWFRKWKEDSEKKIVLTAHYYDDWLAEVLVYYLDKIVVHDRRFGNKENHIYLVQGCPVFDAIEQTEARKKFNLPLDAKILVSFGFIMRWKQLDYVFTHLFPLIASKEEIFLQLLHSYHNRDFEEGERVKAAIHYLIEKYDLGNRVFVSHDFLPKDEINLRMQASDLGFLWKGTAISRGSSAVSKDYVAGRCPIVACQTSHYTDLWRGIEFVSPDIEIGDFCQRVFEVLNDDEKLRKLKQEQEQNYEDINYQKIGKWHMQLYNELLEKKSITLTS